ASARRPAEPRGRRAARTCWPVRTVRAAVFASLCASPLARRSIFPAFLVTVRPLQGALDWAASSRMELHYSAKSPGFSGAFCFPPAACRLVRQLAAPLFAPVFLHPLRRNLRRFSRRAESRRRSPGDSVFSRLARCSRSMSRLCASDTQPPILSPASHEDSETALAKASGGRV